MKALTLKSLKAPLELEDRPSLSPGPDEVIVQLKAASLNRRDYWITQGLYPGIEPPVVLGSDGAGVVFKIGSEVENTWQDREVIIDPGMDWGDNQSVHSDKFSILGLPRDGTFASEVAVSASQLHARPAHLSWQEAAALPLAGVTAWRAVFSQGGLEAGESVLITGIGGGVATFALQFAVATGADVWVTSSSSQKIERAIELGAKGGFDYTSEDWAKRMGKEAGPPNLIIDSAGGTGYRSLVNLAAPGGRIVNYGATAGRPEQLDLMKVFWKQLRLQGSTMGSPVDFVSMLKFVEEKQIVPVVDSVAQLAEGNNALNQMKSSPQFGKYVLTME
ncbi:MAG: zinc-binding dehydrogenase [Planctomycetes bacterium]|nr:zinc-binding dehydrogenase [Planctomycetota bacterium]